MLPARYDDDDDIIDPGKYREVCTVTTICNVRNGHRMLVAYIHNVEHRNLEIRKHVTTSLFRYETFLLLLS